MNSLIALVLLGQILGCTLSHHLDLPSDCNSKEAEQYAALVVDYINAHNVHGYKQALNVIKDITIVKELTGKAIYMELGLLESKCPVLSPTPIENCIVRTQQQHAVEADCDAKLLSVDGSTKVVAVKCHSSPDSVEDLLKLCPDCPVLLPLNDPAVIEAAEYVLHKHNEQNLGRAYKILEISRGQHHHLPNLVYVEFAIVETNCLVQEAHDGQHDCLPKAAADAHVGFCRATVFRKDAATEKLTDEKFESDCVIFDHKAGESHVHLIEHHLGKNIPSPGHNHTVLNLVHSHNDTNASYESHSAEVLPEVAAPVVKREAPPTEVTIIEGHSQDIIPQLKKKYEVETLDFVFLDHWKERYAPDTILLEECGLLRKGSILLADNIVYPGAPEFVKYIRSNNRFDCTSYPTHLEYMQVEDAMEKAVYLG